MRAVGPWSTSRLRNSSVDGSTQCRSSMTKSTGCWAAMRSRIVSRACRVCCFCCSGVRVKGAYSAGSGRESRAAKRGTASASGRPYCTKNPSSLLQLLLRRLLPLETQHYPFQQLDPRIQGAVLVIGRTLARRQPRLGLGGHLLLQHLHQARFANARFAAEQHHLPEAVLDLRPALQQ